ncbi:hypothetical protein Plhal304r1_c032g0103921 [Plasmopara halstedii]
MGLQVQFVAGILLLFAAFEIWRVLMSLILAMIVKAGLLRNIVINSQTKLSVTTATFKISIRKHLWQFLRQPKQKNLFVLMLSSVHIRLVLSNDLTPRSLKGSTSRRNWQTLNTHVSLKDIRHPSWSAVRVWLPHLIFFSRWIHLIELNVISFSVDVERHNEDKRSPIFSIQHGSISMHAVYQLGKNELLCKMIISQNDVSKAVLQGLYLKGTAALGLTEFMLHVPLYQSCEVLCTPIPSAYSVVIDMIELSIDLKQFLQAVLWSKQPQYLNGSTAASCYPNFDSNIVNDDRMCRTVNLLQLAEIFPEKLFCEIHKLKVNVVNRDTLNHLDTLCSLEFNAFRADLMDNTTKNEVFQHVREKSLDFAVMTRKMNLKLSSFAVCISQVDGVSFAPPIIRLEKVNFNTEGFILTRSTIGCESNESEKECDKKQPILKFRFTIRGSSRNMSVALSQQLEPWVASCCTVYDATVLEQQENRLVSHIDNNYQHKLWSIADYCDQESDAQFKVQNISITFQPLSRTCDVLPKCAPSIQFILNEISVYSYPFANEDSSSLRAKADIHCCRLQGFYLTNDDLDMFSFLSIDFVRIFVSPVYSGMQSDVHAEVETEVEWVEVKWAPDVLHAIGGAMELGVFCLASLLHESRHSASELKFTSYNHKSKVQSSVKLAPMHLMEDVSGNVLSSGEVLIFRCVAKHICVIFPLIYCEQQRLDCVTVETFTVSTEKATGRLRISLLDAKAFPSQQSSEKLFEAAKKQTSFFWQDHFRKELITSRTTRDRILRTKEFSIFKTDALFFSAKCFSLEESRIVGTSMTVVDLFVDGVQLKWNISTQLRILELIRQITFSSWEMIYRARSAYAKYCTPFDSIYNRVHGLNPPLDDLDECLRYEKQFADHISASGGKLHRLYATNLTINAKICDQVAVDLTLGVFASDDLPEVWLFQSVSIKVNTLEMVSVARVHVRHTLNEDHDHVFGVLEEMLRKRLFACQRSTSVLEQTVVNGILIEIQTLQIRISHDFPLKAYLDAVQDTFDPFKEQLSAAVLADWRPQQEIFYQYFLRTSVASHRPEVWLRLRDVSFECLGSSFESWLEKIYPLWIEEIAEQELRAHVLDKHIEAHRLSDVDEHNDTSYTELKALLIKNNASAYIWKAKKMVHKTCDGDKGPFFKVSLGHLEFDVSFKEDIATSWDIIKSLDEATKELEGAFKTAKRNFTHFTPSCRFFMGLHVKLGVTDLAVNMRRFLTPLLTWDNLKLTGDIFFTAYNSGEINTDLSKAMRCFLDLSIDIACPVIYFSPGYLYALDDLLRLASGCISCGSYDFDKDDSVSLVDTVRRLLHGNICATITNASVRLFCEATSFQVADFLELHVHQARFAYNFGSIDIELTRVAAKIEPKSLSHIAELSHLKLHIWFYWGCLTNPNMHYDYPIEYIGSDTLSERFILHPPISVDTIPQETGTTSIPKFYQATKLSIFIKGKICPLQPESGDSNEGLLPRGMGAPTAVVLYTETAEYLIKFVQVYQDAFRYSHVRRRNHSVVKPTLMLANIGSYLEGLTIEKFDLIGLDVALYASEKHPVGIRAFLDDRISCSGALFKSSHTIFSGREVKESEDYGADDTKFNVRRLSFLLGDATWIVHDVNVDTRCVQVRVCTSESGSRGEPLVSLQHTSLIIGGGTEQILSHDDSPIKVPSRPVMKRGNTAQLFNIVQSPSEVGTKERAGQSILEYFDIPHENPFSYRESDSDSEDEFEAEKIEKQVEGCQNNEFDEIRRAGFLLGLLSANVRATVTIVAIESLIDIFDTWEQVITTNLPDLFLDLAATATLLENDEQGFGVVVDESNHSPKQFTSLAQDPKFSGLCLQGGADTPANFDKSQHFEPTPYSNADSVRSPREESSFLASQVERAQSSENLNSSRNVNPKKVQDFIMVKFEDCQISIQNQRHKGSVLLALSSGTLQHAISQDSSRERINLNVDGFQVFTAPLDVDVKSHVTWLKSLSDGLYCPSSYGLLRQVIAPIPTQVTIWIDHENSLDKNKIKLEIPAIEIHINPVSKEILEKLIATIIELIHAKRAEKKSRYNPFLLQQSLKKVLCQKRSFHQLLAIKRQLKWKIAALQGQQRCGRFWHLDERAMIGQSALKNALYSVLNLEKAYREHLISSESSANDVLNAGLISFATLIRYGGQIMDGLLELTQKYEALSDLTRSMAHEIQEQYNSSFMHDVDIELTLDRASLTLHGEFFDIVRTQLSSLSLQMQLFEDHSGKFTLCLQKFSIINLSPATPYPDLLLPTHSRSWAGDEVFLRINAEIAKPINNTTIIQHFEVNVHPIQVCITQEIILQLIAFFAPSDNTDNIKDEKREEVRSQFLQARTCSTSDKRVGSAIFKAVKVAGKTVANPLNHGRASHGDSDEQIVPSCLNSKAETVGLVSKDPSQWIAQLVNLSPSHDLLPFTSDDADQHAPQILNDEKSDRVSSSTLFKRIRLGTVEVVLTYKNKKSNIGNSSTSHLHHPHMLQPQALEDMRGFEIKTRALVYCDKSCSPFDLLLRIRRDILLDVLSQVGRNFTNIGNFLRDQIDLSCWAAFDGLAPLKSLSTTVSSFKATGLSHTGVVVPYPDSTDPNGLDSEKKDKDPSAVLISSTSTTFHTGELLYTRRGSDVRSGSDADSATLSIPRSIDTAHHKPIAVKRIMTNLFSRKKSSLLPAPFTSS